MRNLRRPTRRETGILGAVGGARVDGNGLIGIGTLGGRLENLARCDPTDPRGCRLGAVERPRTSCSVSGRWRSAACASGPRLTRLYAAPKAAKSTGTASLKLASDPLGSQFLNDSAEALARTWRAEETFDKVSLSCCTAGVRACHELRLVRTWVKGC
jgi:hypothetical protein